MFFGITFFFLAFVSQASIPVFLVQVLMLWLVLLFLHEYVLREHETFNLPCTDSKSLNP